jgi:hypothetical protein
MHLFVQREHNMHSALNHNGLRVLRPSLFGATFVPEHATLYRRP